MPYLLEFLFLLADHIGYLEKNFDNNPFDNDILNDEIIKIMKQGWNTIISPEYINLLNINLNIEDYVLDLNEKLVSYDVINNIYKYLQNLQNFQKVQKYKIVIFGFLDFYIFIM